MPSIQVRKRLKRYTAQTTSRDIREMCVCTTSTTGSGVRESSTATETQRHTCTHAKCKAVCAHAARAHHTPSVPSVRTRPARAPQHTPQVVTADSSTTRGGLSSSRTSRSHARPTASVHDKSHASKSNGKRCMRTPPSPPAPPDAFKKRVCSRKCRGEPRACINRQLRLGGGVVAVALRYVGRARSRAGGPRAAGPLPIRRQGIGEEAREQHLHQPGSVL